MLLIIPVTARALCEGTITLTGKIEIDANKEFCVISDDCFRDSIDVENSGDQGVSAVARLRICRRVDETLVSYSEPLLNDSLPWLLNYVDYKTGDKITRDYLNTLFAPAGISEYENVNFVPIEFLKLVDEARAKEPAVFNEVEKLTGNRPRSFPEAFDLISTHFGRELNKTYEYIESNPVLKEYFALDQKLRKYEFIPVRLPDAMRSKAEGCYLIVQNIS